jgi:hypothetical protein
VNSFSESILREWLAEFEAQGHEVPGSIRILHQDLDPTSFDHGLVLVSLKSTPTDVYLQRPVEADSPFRVSFAPRQELVELDYYQVERMSQELSMVAKLAEFLGRKAGNAFVASADEAARNVDETK